MTIRPSARPAPRSEVVVRARPRASTPATVTPGLPPAPPAPAPASSAPRADYTVGKNKPPVHTRWQKGQSGNPRGKQKGTPNTDTLVVELMDGLVPVKTSGGERKMARQAALLQRMWELAAKGNLRAAQFLFDRYAQAQARRTSQAADAEPLAREERAILESHLAALGFDDGKEVS